MILINNIKLLMKVEFKNMKNKNVYISALIISLLFLIIDKFILISEYGWVEIITFIMCVTILIFSIIKLYQLSKLNKVAKITLGIITIIIVLWFSLLSIDYNRHKNLYGPLFSIGYKVEQSVDIQTGRIYRNKSTFYLFGIKIDEVKAIINESK